MKNFKIETTLKITIKTPGVHSAKEEKKRKKQKKPKKQKKQKNQRKLKKLEMFSRCPQSDPKKKFDQSAINSQKAE